MMLNSPFNVVFVLMMFFGGEINVNECDFWSL